MRALLVALAVCGLCACPNPSGNDGGTGGGFAFGGGTGFPSGGGTGITGGGAGAETLDSFCSFATGTQTSTCQTAASCGLYSDAQGCSSYIQSRGAPSFDLCAFARAGIDAGVLLFDAQAAAECKASYLDCDATSNACANVLEGAGGNGADCDSVTPCQRGYYCAGNGTCPGHCTPQQPGGSIVRFAGACAESTWARTNFLSDGGIEYECVAKVALGHACTTTTECVAPTNCDQALGTCQPPAAEGAACPYPAEFSNFCSPSLRLACQPQVDGGAVCGRRATRGEACGYCVTDLRCITDGGAFGVCGDLAEQGEACQDPTECATGALTCEGGQCVPLPGEAGTCTDSFRCQAGLTCQYGFADGGVVGRCEYYDAGTAPTCQQTEQP